MINRHFEILPNTISFENKSFENEFLKCGGIDYLNFIVIYIKEIPKDVIRENKELWEEM